MKVLRCGMGLECLCVGVKFTRSEVSLLVRELKELREHAGLKQEDESGLVGFLLQELEHYK